MAAAELIDFAANIGKKKRRDYLDRKYYSTLEEQQIQKDKSTTAYVGNLSFYTSETQIYNFFSQAGMVERIIMGLNKNTKKPCGFCFVVYLNRSSLLTAAKYLNGVFFDGMKVKVEIDPGFKEGRQYGRGREGSQVQDERRGYVDYFRQIGDTKRQKT